MDNAKNDHYFTVKIRKDLMFIVEHTRDIEIEELNENEVLLDSMMFRLIQISENAKRLSNEFIEQHRQIPWTAMFGLRNRIVHDYGNVDLEVVYSALKNDIPELLEKLQEDGV